MRVLRGLEELSMEERSFSVEGVREIIDEVRRKGDEALFECTERFDGVALSAISVPEEKIEKAKVDEALEKALKESRRRLELFSKEQMGYAEDFSVEVAEGVEASCRVRAIERIGIYVPSGRAPLFSTLLMCAVPAIVAGVEEIAVCTPPPVREEILYVAKLCGISEVYSVGGAQAIAALAFGTESIKRVDKIFGPGNRYVTAAKREVFGYVGIDMLAGPSEVLIIAQDGSDVEAIALDLIAQAEHGSDSMALLLTDSEALAERVSEEVDERLKGFDWAREAIERKGAVILVNDTREAVEMANRIAPEHLELMDGRIDENELRNYGTLFVGAPVAFGDYCAGVNHVLPTGGSARYSSALTVRDFLKVSNALRVGGEGRKHMGCAEIMAEHEGMEAHAASLRHRTQRA